MPNWEIFGQTPSGGEIYGPTALSLSAMPTVTAVRRGIGPAVGGGTVTLTGTNFVVGATTVTFGGTSATGVTVSSSTTLTCTLPAHAAGSVAVAATTSGGTGTWSGSFVYLTMADWHRPDLGITIGTGVSAWADQSGSGDTNKNVAQPTGSAQPTYTASDAAYNNRSTLSFASASSQFLVSGSWSSSLALPETIFLVGNDDGSSTSQYWTDGGATNQRVTAGGLAGAGKLTIYNGTTLSGTGASGTKQIFVGYFDSSTGSKVWSSAITPIATGTAGTTAGSRTGLTVGAASGATTLLNGKLAEVLIVSGALGATDFSNVMTELGLEYNITVGP